MVRRDTNHSRSRTEQPHSDIGAADNPSLRVDCPDPSLQWFAMAIHWTLGCDANDPHRLADFWAQALGYVKEPGYDDPDGASIIDPEGKAPAIGWLRVPEGKSAKNRLHIDIRVAGEGPWDMASPGATDPSQGARACGMRRHCCAGRV